MFNDGFIRITNIDFSKKVIDLMSSKFPHEKDQSFECKNPYKCLDIEMNCKDLKFDDETFDVVIDKGTLDAILVHYNDNITLVFR